MTEIGTPPNVDLVSESRDATFSLTSNKPGATFECAFDEAADQGTYSACGATFSRTGLALGEHTLLVRAVDAAGNRDLTPYELEWTIGVMVPKVAITAGPADGSTQDSPDATFEFSAAVRGITYECSRDGGTFSACSSPYSLTGLGVGPTPSRCEPTTRPFERPAGGAVGRGPSPTARPPRPPWATPPRRSPVTAACSPWSSSSAARTPRRPSSAPSTPEPSRCARARSKLTRARRRLAHVPRARRETSSVEPDPTPANHEWRVVAEPDTTILTGPGSRTSPPSDRAADLTFSSGDPEATFECSLDVEDAWSGLLLPAPPDRPRGRRPHAVGPCRRGGHGG